jgi:hypothetical protein
VGAVVAAVEVVDVLTSEKHLFQAPFCDEHRYHWRRHIHLAVSVTALVVGILVTILGTLGATVASGPAAGYAVLAMTLILTLAAAAYCFWANHNLVRLVDTSRDQLVLGHVDGTFIEALEHQRDQHAGMAGPTPAASAEARQAAIERYREVIDEMIAETPPQEIAASLKKEGVPRGTAYYILSGVCAEMPAILRARYTGWTVEGYIPLGFAVVIVLIMVAAAFTKVPLAFHLVVGTIVVLFLINGGVKWGAATWKYNLATRLGRYRREELAQHETDASAAPPPGALRLAQVRAVIHQRESRHLLWLSRLAQTWAYVLVTLLFVFMVGVVWMALAQGGWVRPPPRPAAPAQEGIEKKDDPAKKGGPKEKRVF